MSIEGIKFCDLCGEAILVYEVAPVKIERDGHFRQFHYHNRHNQDCLAQELSLLHSEYMAVPG